MEVPEVVVKAVSDRVRPNVELQFKHGSALQTMPVYLSKEQEEQLYNMRTWTLVSVRPKGGKR